jgi:hypothetical protein
MNPEHDCSCTSKYLREHTASLKDIIFTRREFLERTGMGFGAMSLASILGLSLGGNAQAAAASGKALSPLAPKQPHFPVKAKAVIHIFAEGGPSHVDTWDPKPELAKYADKTLPGLDGLAFPSPFKFNKMGKSGIEVSEVFPKLG